MCVNCILGSITCHPKSSHYRVYTYSFLSAYYNSKNYMLWQLQLQLPQRHNSSEHVAK